MVLFLSGLVLIPLNKMVVQNENIVTFLMLSAPFSFLPLFLSAFGVRLHSLLCTPLIVFLHQLHTTNHHLSFFMVKLLITPPFGFFGCACFVSLPPHERTKLQPRTRLCCFLGYGVSQRGFATMIPFLIAFVSPVMLSFGNIVLSQVFSSFLHLLP